MGIHQEWLYLTFFYNKITSFYSPKPTDTYHIEVYKTSSVLWCCWFGEVKFRHLDRKNFCFKPFGIALNDWMPSCLQETVSKQKNGKYIHTNNSIHNSNNKCVNFYGTKMQKNHYITTPFCFSAAARFCRPPLGGEFIFSALVSRSSSSSLTGDFNNGCANSSKCFGFFLQQNINLLSLLLMYETVITNNIIYNYYNSNYTYWTTNTTSRVTAVLVVVVVHECYYFRQCNVM